VAVVALGVTWAAAVGAQPSDSVRLRLGGPIPFLRVLGGSLVRLRIENGQARALEGGSTADWDGGRPLAFAGAWFAREPAADLAQFEVTVRLSTPVPPGAVQEIDLPLRPVRPGPQWLCFGLVRSSRDGSAYGPLTRPVCEPVEIAPGSFLDNHRSDLLNVIVGAHWTALVACVLGALWMARARR